MKAKYLIPCGGRWLGVFVLSGWLFMLPGAYGLTLISAQTRGNPNGLTVCFSTSLDAATATNPVNYTTDRGVTVNSVTLIETSKVRLNTSLIAEGQLYTLAVNGVLDRANSPSTIALNSRITFLQTQGVLTRKEFDVINGGLLADLT